MKSFYHHFILSGNNPLRKSVYTIIAFWFSFIHGYIYHVHLDFSLLNSCYCFISLSCYIFDYVSHVADIVSPLLNPVLFFKNFFCFYVQYSVSFLSKVVFLSLKAVDSMTSFYSNCMHDMSWQETKALQIDTSMVILPADKCNTSKCCETIYNTQKKKLERLFRDDVIGK